MLSGENILVTGGTFNQHNDHRQFHWHAHIPNELESLQKAASPAAFHNSGERFDPPKCHPNTRVAVLNKITDWIVGLDTDTHNALVMWLHGAAGAGKSAIAQTIADFCQTEGYLLAAFFFGRSDPTRNHSRNLFASIAYQLALTLPQTRGSLAAAVEHDPLIFTRSLSAQFSSLIVQPFKELLSSGFFSDSRDSPRLIIIDGLDECLSSSEQSSILDVILEGIRRHHLPLIFLITSRTEYSLSAKFNTIEMNSVSTRLALDDTYFPSHDIKLFLQDQFKEIRLHHPFRQFMHSSWPTDDVINKIVLKSSGQFVYASTVIKYVKSDRHLPTHRLDIILKLRSPSRDLPFAELDALYIHLLNSVEDLEMVLDIISFSHLYSSAVYTMEEVMLLGPGKFKCTYLILVP